MHVCRKYADIGHTVQLQYREGRGDLAEGWAELVTAHPLPGVGVVEGLRGVMGEGRGCVLVAEMSSAGNLAIGEYTKGNCLVRGECVGVGRVVIGEDVRAFSWDYSSIYGMHHFKVRWLSRWLLVNSVANVLVCKE